MVLLLARCWDYKLKTEDVLELTQGNRRIALCTVVGLLEDGETYSTVLKQRQRPTEGQMAQWEHELIIQRYAPLVSYYCICTSYICAYSLSACSLYEPVVSKHYIDSVVLLLCRFEKPLLLQICRLLRGFTHPGCYFMLCCVSSRVTCAGCQAHTSRRLQKSLLSTGDSI